MEPTLNARAQTLVLKLIPRTNDLRIDYWEIPAGGHIFDFGVKAAGGLTAGLMLARVCLADLAHLSIVSQDLGGIPLPSVQVFTDHPVAACLACQYAGWSIHTDSGYSAIGSGPMRAAFAGEDIFEKIGFTERADSVVGILETRTLPSGAVVSDIASKIGVSPKNVYLLAAPAASVAGCIQIVSRSVETALHKLHELKFDLGRIECGWGSAPLPPVARDDLAAIGRTNDSILYGGKVVLWVRGDDESLESIGPQIPSSSSRDHGAPFVDIFERYDRDFYSIDPLLFSPAQIVFQNLDSGKTQTFGKPEPEILARSLYQ